MTNNVVEVLGNASNIPLSQAARKREDPKHCQQRYEDDCVDRKSRKIKHENTLSKQSLWESYMQQKLWKRLLVMCCIDRATSWMT